MLELFWPSNTPDYANNEPRVSRGFCFLFSSSSSALSLPYKTDYTTCCCIVYICFTFYDSLLRRLMYTEQRSAWPYILLHGTQRAYYDVVHISSNPHTNTHTPTFHCFLHTPKSIISRGLFHRFLTDDQKIRKTAIFRLFTGSSSHLLCIKYYGFLMDDDLILITQVRTFVLVAAQKYVHSGEIGVLEQGHRIGRHEIAVDSGGGRKPKDACV